MKTSEHAPDILQASSPEELLVHIKTLEGKVAQLESENERLRALASTDALTGLPNRHGLSVYFQKVEAELASKTRPAARERREGGPGRRRDQESPKYSMIALDLDNFKAINDLYNHAVGNAALKEVASYIRQNIRGYDFAARLGGEEFVMILRSTPEAVLQKFSNKDPRNPRAIMNVALRIVHAVDGNGPHSEGMVEVTRPYDRAANSVSEITLHSNAMTPQEIKLTSNMTFSGGISPLIPGDTFESAYGRADLAAKVAKGQGKDRLITYEKGMVAPREDDRSR